MKGQCLLGTLGTNPAIINLAPVEILSLSHANADFVGSVETNFTVKTMLVGPYSFITFRAWILGAWARVTLNFSMDRLKREVSNLAEFLYM